jgi:hypothetical protein
MTNREVEMPMTINYYSDMKKRPQWISHLINQDKLLQFLPVLYQITFQCWRKVYEVKIDSQGNEMRE